jgi:DNA (cytosine-5)-methyltransferase 1
MECLGYKNHVKIFNSKHFQLPQNRERIFIISIRKDIETNFDLNEIKLNHTINPIKNFIEDIDNIDKRHFVTRPLRPLNIKQKSDIITVGEVSSKGSQAGKVYDINGLFPTICAGTHGYAFGYIYQNNKVRQITPQEAFLFMGFSKKEYKQCEELGISHTQLYKMAGNAIAVPILEEIFKKLL